MAGVQIEKVDIAADVAEVLLAAAEGTAAGSVWVLPRYVKDGIGLYADAVQMVPKELRREGVPAQFAHGSERRRVLSEYSEDLAFQIAIGVAQNMTWDGAKLICQYLWARAHTLGGPSARVSVEVDLVHPDGTLEGVRVSGLANDATAVELLRVLAGREEPGEDS